MSPSTPGSTPVSGRGCLPRLTETGSVYRGEPTEPVVSIAFANSGDLQVELIEQEDDAPSIYREFLDAGREGFHHLAWWPRTTTP